MNATDFQKMNRRCQEKARRGFTLVELLVTVALVSVLMLAVTQIFSIASQTIGGGQAIGASTRDAQAAQSVFAQDLAGVSSDSPYFIIRSTQTYAPRNVKDALSDPNQVWGNVDLNGDTLEDNIHSLEYNFRNHRQDFLLFFSRQMASRQTGNDTGGALIAEMKGNEFAVFYHHLNLADNAGVNSGNTDPGVSNLTTNPNNFVASQWALGRVAVMLTPSDSGAIYNKGIGEAGREAQEFVARGTGLSPLTPGSMSTLAPATALKTSRLDLADSSFEAFNAVLKQHFGSPKWELNASYTVGQIVELNGRMFRCEVAHTSSPNTKYPAMTPPDPSDPPRPYWSYRSTTNWNELLMTRERFEANAFVATPLNAATAAKQHPIFVPGCTQFIVEFAGDFFAQDPAGAVIANSLPDGVIDYTPTGQVRWYGMPRDTNGDGKIVAAQGDVAPVRDMYGKALPFEYAFPNGDTSKPPVTSNYFESADLVASPTYEVAWTASDPNKPRMIRITMVVDRLESDSRQVDGTPFEYVFNVGR